jgi:hypothetical protein
MTMNALQRAEPRPTRVSLPFTAHRLGLNCGSSPFRDVLEHHGFNFTEDMIFGLGSGLQLAYHHGDQLVPDRHWRAPLTIVTGRSIAPYQEAASVLGVQLYARRNLPADRAWRDLRDHLQRGMPVVCEIDREEMLPLVGQSNPLTVRFGWRFGGHKTIVIGYDEEANTATIVENMLPDPVVVPLDMLGRMRDTPAALYPPENDYYVISPPRRLLPLKAAIRIAIAKNVQAMRHPEYRGTGLSAVDWLADELGGWPELLAPERLAASILMAWVQSEHLSGGGMYRNLYARFLRQADDALGEPRLVRAARMYRSLARQWSALVLGMKDALDRDDLRLFSSPELRRDVAAIARAEHDGIDLLEEITGSWF